MAACKQLHDLAPVAKPAHPQQRNACTGTSAGPSTHLCDALVMCAILAGVGGLGLGIHGLAANVLLVEIAAQTSAAGVQLCALAVRCLRREGGVLALVSSGTSLQLLARLHSQHCNAPAPCTLPADGSACTAASAAHSANTDLGDALVMCAVLAWVNRLGLGIDGFAANVLLVEVAAQAGAASVQLCALAVRCLRQGQEGWMHALVSSGMPLHLLPSLPPTAMQCAHPMHGPAEWQCDACIAPSAAPSTDLGDALVMCAVFTRIGGLGLGIHGLAPNVLLVEIAAQAGTAGVQLCALAIGRLRREGGLHALLSSGTIVCPCCQACPPPAVQRVRPMHALSRTTVQCMHCRVSCPRHAPRRCTGRVRCLRRGWRAGAGNRRARSQCPAR